MGSLRITVVKAWGEAPSEPNSVVFGESGGVIGRSATCTLSLTDPYQHISREQVRVTCNNGEYFVTVCGAANLVFLNGQELPKDLPVALRPESILNIGEFELKVEALTPALPADPISPTPVESPTAFWNSLGSDLGAASPNQKTDPFADIFGQASGSFAATPVAQPAQSASPAPSPFFPPNLPPAQTPGGPHLIPDDIDLWGDLNPAAKQAAASSPQIPQAGAFADLGLGAPPALPGQSPSLASAENIDQLFGLGGLKSGPTHDPLKDFFAPPSPLPNEAQGQGYVDALLNTPKPFTDAPLKDHTPEIFGTFNLPQPSAKLPNAAVPLQPTAKPIAPSGPGSVAPAPAPITPDTKSQGGSYRSWERQDAQAPVNPVSGAQNQSQSKAGLGLIQPDQVQEIAAQVAAQNRHIFEETVPTQATKLINQLNDRSLEAQRAFDTVAGSVDNQSLSSLAATNIEEQLLSGLLKGLNLTELPSTNLSATAVQRRLTPELMQKIGELLRLSTQGTLELLEGRSLLKREMKAEVTVIVSKGNNPLKFSPNTESALAHLLSQSPIRGFMSGPASITDAFEDLGAHQMAFVAGMRAAIANLIDKFDPSQLESRLTKKSVLESMVPATRKAKLWERFGELYADISKEAEDDFEAFFGKEFVAAYEQQIAQLDLQKKNS